MFIQGGASVAVLGLFNQKWPETKTKKWDEWNIKDNNYFNSRRDADQYFYEFGSDRAAAVKQIHKVYGATSK